MRTDEATWRSSDEAVFLGQVRALVRERPFLTAIAAGAVGAAIGGLLLGRAARLVFLGALGYVANELWRNEGRFDVLGKLSR